MKDGLLTYSNGTRFWYKDDKLHRLDGPAIEWVDGSKSWWKNGVRHRVDGPAVIYPDGYKEWWYEDKLLKINQESIRELLEVVVG